MKDKTTGAAASDHTVAWMKQNPSMTQSALGQRAKRAAKRVGLRATKSLYRRYPGSIDNYGGFQLVNVSTKTVVEGVRYKMSAQEVLDYCAERERTR